MGLTSWLVEKIVIYGMVIGFFYIIGENLGIVPKPLKDLVLWVAENFIALALFVCFMSSLYVVYKIAKIRGGKGK